VKQLRDTFMQHLPDLPVVRLKCIDESGIHLGMTRLYGRAAPGQRVIEATPDYSGPHYTLVSALGTDGISAPWVFEGAMNGPAFTTYVSEVLAPTLCQGDIVVLDNLSAHQVCEARAAIEARGASMLFLPPYSSDMNPIELAWSKVKAALRKAKARTWDVLVDALAHALRSISAHDACAWFAHCGYAVNQ
jgi:transposase